MNREEVDRMLHAALDARRDPFDDPDFASALVDHDDLARVVTLRAALAGLPEASVPVRSTPRRVVAIAAAAALLLVALRFHERIGVDGEGPTHARRDSVAPAVLAYRVSSSLHSRDRSQSIVVDSTGYVARTLRTDRIHAVSSIRIHSESVR